MTTQEVKRKLAAILSADVKGYSRLMGENEKGTVRTLNAYKEVMRSLVGQYRGRVVDTPGDNVLAEFAREAVALDPKYAFPYAILANAHMLDVWFRFSESPEKSMRLAADAVHKALALDDTDPHIHSALTGLYVMQRQHDKAIASAGRALELGPGAARSQSTMGTALIFACRFSEAIPFFEEAIRLDPYPPATQFRALGGAYSAVGRYDEALTAYKKALQLNPNDIFAHLGLAGLFVLLGREEEARAEAREVLRIHPKFSLDHFAKTLSYKDQSIVDRRIDALRKAGLK